jgi:DNA-binding MarR family transcriptional regulator
LAIAPAPLKELPKLDEHRCFALYAAGNHMTRLFVPFLKKLGITYPQYLVLVVLWECDQMSVGELAAALQMDLGSISPMLKRMERNGLLGRDRDPNDERRVVVSLSASGHALRQRTKQMLGESLSAAGRTPFPRHRHGRPVARGWRAPPASLLSVRTVLPNAPWVRPVVA